VGGKTHVARANREVILCSGAIQSPQLLQLSGIGPSALLKSHGIECIADLPRVGQGLKDHLTLLMAYPAPGIGVSMMAVGPSLGPDALRENPTQVFDKGPLPADPSQDENLSNELKQLKAHAEQLFSEYTKTGTGLPASTLYDASVFYSSGEGDHHSHDIQISVFCSAFNRDAWESSFHYDCSKFFADPNAALAPTAENIILLPGLMQPHSEGSVSILSRDPMQSPEIDYGYFTDPHDVKVFQIAMRHANEIAESMDGVGSLYVPADLAAKHAYNGSILTDALLEDWILHYAVTYYHPTCTCRIGSVVDSHLKVMGVSKLRIADASVMPEIISGNTQAACYMIAENAALMIAKEHSLALKGSHLNEHNVAVVVQ